jgi:hypothetical protein
MLVTIPDRYEPKLNSWSDDGDNTFLQMLVTAYKTKRRHNPHDHNPHLHRRENLKSHKIKFVRKLLAWPLTTNFTKKHVK